MLGSMMKIVSFVPTRDSKNARSFYEDALGLRFLSEDQFALEFDANGIVVRVTNVSSVPSFAPAPFTILGWSEAPTCSRSFAAGCRSVASPTTIATSRATSTSRRFSAETRRRSRATSASFASSMPRRLARRPPRTRAMPVAS